MTKDGDTAPQTPIAVLSFNRPALLRKVLESLRHQEGAIAERRGVHLFQDGAVNRYSRVRYANDEDIRGSISVFREIFPSGIVHASADNVGVCENFARAEEFMFEEIGAECAYFFEDDMELSSAYLAIMDRLQWYSRSARLVAYFAAYGDYYADQASVQARRDQIITMDHHWAFGLFRSHWRRIRGQLEEYYSIVRGNDYTRRDHHAVYELYRQQGASPRGSSQDAAKAFACAKLGLWRCRTVMPFARYIGSQGAHMSQALYNELGFDRTVVSKDAHLKLKFPGEAEIRAAIAEEGALYRRVFMQEMDKLTAGLGRKLNPSRLCTEADVIAAYQLLLHRQPENDAAIQSAAGKKTVFELVQAMTKSSEYQELNGKLVL